MKILLTGGNGFIGRNVVPILNKDHTILACNSQTCDIFDFKSIREIIKQFRPTHCLHLAWNVQKNYLNNPGNMSWLTASSHLIREFYAWGGKRFVGVGTCLEYSPVSEARSEVHTPTMPDTIYGKCKLALGNYLDAFASCEQKSWAWCRPFYIVGPTEPLHRLISAACLASMKKRDFFSCGYYDILDYIDVRDVASALVKILYSEYNGVINIGTGKGIQTCKILNIINTISKNRLSIKYSSQSNDLCIIGDTEILKTQIDFNYKHSIESSIKDIYKHIRGHHYESA